MAGPVRVYPAMEINGSNAAILFLLGWAMRLLPGIAPAWFPPTGCDGTNGQAIWLHAMGAIEELIGSWYA